MVGALDGDRTPRAATALLNKDVAIAIDAAGTLKFDTPLARAARDVFAAAVAAGYGSDDDAALLQFYHNRVQRAEAPDRK